MVPNKLENQIKEKLNEREIQPSAQAWDRLDAMLSVAEEKKNKRATVFSIKTIGIAASILLFVSLGLYFFNKNEIKYPQNEVVVNESSNDNDNSNDNSNNNEKAIIKNKNQVAQTIKNQQSSESFNPINQKTNQESIINKDKEIEYQVSEVIAQKELPKIINQEKTEMPKKVSVNVDDLLASVEKPKKTENKLKIKVNAQNLLSQVDGEIDQTFKEKMLKKLNTNYQEIKVAIETRNTINTARKFQ